MSTTDPNEPLLSHEYDGIRELDNPLPLWWQVTFYVTIIFGALYWFHYHTSIVGSTSQEELEVGMAEIEASRNAAAAKAPKVTEEALAALVSDTNSVDSGKAEYIGKCAACHGNAGEGLIGPNLTDNHWIYTKGTLVGLHHTIVEGAPAKGMPAWKGLISAEKIKDVTAYVATLKGTNPPNAKAPQGDVFE